MGNYLLAPDSFKGTMSSTEVCEIMERAIRSVDPDAGIVRVPLADGGEGSVEALISAAGGKLVETTATGPDGAVTPSFFGMLDGGTAVIEMAAAAGLPMAAGKTGVMEATTFGVGELISKALDAGSRRILLGLGGSATNDGGCGMAAALGVKFLDKDGEPFVPVGGNLSRIDRIDMSGLDKRIGETDIELMCDIDNPLTGELGAAEIFGPQKGASPEDIVILDAGLAHLAQVALRDVGFDMLTLPGAGAAGGMGGGAAAFLGGHLRRGIDLVLSVSDFATKAGEADLIITGEGRVDDQSAMGKAISGVARGAKAAGKPLFVIAGDVKREAAALYEIGVTSIFSTNLRAVPFEKARLTSKEDLEFVTRSVIGAYMAGRP